MLGLDPLFISGEPPPHVALGSRWTGGGPFVVHHTPPRGSWGDGDCLGGGKTPPFLGGIPPNPALGMMASAPGMGVEHGGGEAVPPHPPPAASRDGGGL